MSLEEVAALPDIPTPILSPAADWLRAPPEFLELLPLAIYACAPDGRLLWFNRRACELWGRTPRLDDPSELYCGSFKVFLDDRQIGRDETPMAQVLRSGVAVRGAEARVERPDGTSVWAVVHVEPVRDDSGKLVGAINCFHESAAPSLEQQRRLAATYEAAGIGIVEVDADGRLLRLNAHLRDLLDYPAHELIGHSVFDFTHSDDAAADREQYRRQVAGEIDGYSIEKRFRRRDGSYIWANVTSRSVRDNHNRFLYAVRVQQDITQRKQAEDVIASFN